MIPTIHVDISWTYVNLYCWYHTLLCKQHLPPYSSRIVIIYLLYLRSVRVGHHNFKTVSLLIYSRHMQSIIMGQLKQCSPKSSRMWLWVCSADQYERAFATELLKVIVYRMHNNNYYYSCVVIILLYVCLFIICLLNNTILLNLKTCFPIPGLRLCGPKADSHSNQYKCVIIMVHIILYFLGNILNSITQAHNYTHTICIPNKAMSVCT